jgi:hypothetical protein
MRKQFYDLRLGETIRGIPLSAVNMTPLTIVEAPPKKCGKCTNRIKKRKK